MRESSSVLSAMEISAIIGITKRAVQLRMQSVPSVPLPGRGAPRGWPIAALPLEWQAKVLASGKAAAPLPPVARDSSQAWAQYDRKPASIKAEAERRLAALVTVEELRAGGLGKIAAIEAASPAHGVPVPTLRRWSMLVEGLHRADWLPALAPRYTGRTAMVDIDPAVFDFWKALWLSRSQPPAATCYAHLKTEAKRQGWRVPSLATLLRRTKREVPAPAIVLARKGEAALERMFPAQERDRSAMHAMQWVVADARRHDLFVAWPDGTIGRPYLLAWQDVYSGMILAWRVDRSENRELVRLSFGDMVERWGIPEVTYLDNGRGFASKWITGGQKTRFRFKIRDEDPEGCITAVGSKVRWATPGHGQAKPIERAFGDLVNYIDKHPAFAGCWIGNKPEMRPEEYDGRTVPLAQFIDVAARAVADHNAREGRRSPTCNGRSFAETFAESYRAHPPRRATAAQRAYWLLAAEGVTARVPDGAIYLGRNRYWCEALARHIGEKLIVRFDPQRLQAPVQVYALDGSLIATPDCVEAGGFDSIEDAREHARAKRQYVKAHKAALAAEKRMSTLAAGRLLLDHEPPAETEAPQTKIARPVFGAPSAAVRAQRAAELQARQIEDADEITAGLDQLEEMRRRRGAA